MPWADLAGIGLDGAMLAVLVMMLHRLGRIVGRLEAAEISASRAHERIDAMPRVVVNNERRSRR